MEREHHFGYGARIWAECDGSCTALREKSKANLRIVTLRDRLANPGFTAKAPSAIVDKAETELHQLETKWR